MAEKTAGAGTPLYGMMLHRGDFKINLQVNELVKDKLLSDPAYAEKLLDKIIALKQQENQLVKEPKLPDISHAEAGLSDHTVTPPSPQPIQEETFCDDSLELDNSTSSSTGGLCQQMTDLTCSVKSRVVIVSNLPSDIILSHFYKSCLKKIGCEFENVNFSEIFDENKIKIEFTDPASAQRALKVLNMWEYDDNFLEVTLAPVPEEQQVCKVVISDLASDVIEEHLHKTVMKRLSCSQLDIVGWSTIENNQIIYEFTTPELASKAVSVFNNLIYDGALVTAQLQQPQQSRTVIVSNLPSDVITSHFHRTSIKKIGCSLEDLKFSDVNDKGQIEIEFTDPALAQRAATVLNMLEYDDVFLEAVLGKCSGKQSQSLKRPLEPQSSCVDPTLRSPSRKNIREAGGWIEAKVKLLIQLLKKLKESKPVKTWTEEDWAHISDEVGMPVQACKSKKSKLYDQHSAIVRAGQPTSWAHIEEVHVLKFGSLAKGPSITIVKKSNGAGIVNAAEATPGKTWDNDDGNTKCKKLVGIWAEERKKREVKSAFISNSQFWRNVAAGMGPPFTDKICKYQMEQFLDRYKRIADSSNSVAAAKNWPLFKTIDAVLGQSVIMKPVSLVAVGSSHVLKRFGDKQ